MADPERVGELEGGPGSARRLREIAALLSTLSPEDIMLSLRDRLQSLIACEHVTLFVKDPAHDEIFSRAGDGEPLPVRLHVSVTSVAGYAAVTKRIVRIDDVYDREELEDLDLELRYDGGWDRKTGSRSRHLLAAPIVRDGKLLGVIQCINNRDGRPFRDDQVALLVDLASLLAPALEGTAKGHAPPPSGGVEAEKKLSEYYRCPYLAFSPDYPVPYDLLAKFTVDYMKHDAFVPLARVGDRSIVILANPNNLALRDDIERRLGHDVIVHVSTREDVFKFIDYFLGDAPAAEPEPAAPAIGYDAIIQQIESQSATGRTEESSAELLEDDVGMVRLVNQLIEKANEMGASDIHIEPYLDGDVVVRMRVDGVCTEHVRLPKKFGRNIVARIKILSNIDIAERRVPQDGKIRFRMPDGKKIELRVATLPTAGGHEDAVLRILAGSKALSLEQLGMETDTYERFKRVVQEPYGIILCVGPTGSGKTTTLHSALAMLNKPDVKICTAEDPVEITQPGLRQVNVHPKIGFTFERALRAFLRCDPDIIMIGEMRDLETAGAAIEASLTGHLVFSTLHTNNAPETVTRLLDMGMDPFTFGDSLVAVQSQRLVRTLCSKCKETYTPDEAEWARLRSEFGDDALFEKLGGDRTKAGTARPRGCETCHKTGYKGRIGVHELLVVDDEVRHLVYSKALASKIREVAIRGGMVMLKQDGIRKALKGLTDFTEVRSVCMK